ncbi:MAG: hypothetical protein HFF50_10520 [Lawsonibacter sp.]|nr:hypothetical protein [Lawsonibacter sp.]
MNVYHTPAYQAHRQKYAFSFSEAHRVPSPGRTFVLPPGWSVHSRHYYAEQGSFACRTARHQLLDSEGQMVYTWDNLNPDGEFYTLVPHANGRHYLIFREDLYGYSVLETETGQTLHYLPEKSWPWDKKGFLETFIWTDTAYDPRTNLLAAYGCYWGGGNNMQFLDFTHPLEEQDCAVWLDIHDVVDPEYDLYDDIDLERFGEDGFLSFRTLSAEDGSQGGFRFPEDSLLDLVQKKKLTSEERG